MIVRVQIPSIVSCHICVWKRANFCESSRHNQNIYVVVGRGREIIRGIEYIRQNCDEEREEWTEKVKKSERERNGKSFVRGDGQGEKLINMEKCKGVAKELRMESARRDERRGRQKPANKRGQWTTNNKATQTHLSSIVPHIYQLFQQFSISLPNVAV